jgi:26S proteasome regulatory subunit N1
LAGEIGFEFAARQDKEEKVDDLLGLVADIVPFQVAHNAEVEAIDLLIEVEQLQAITERINKDNVERIGRYLLSLTPLQGVEVEEQVNFFCHCYPFCCIS